LSRKPIKRFSVSSPADPAQWVITGAAAAGLGVLEQEMARHFAFLEGFSGLGHALIGQIRHAPDGLWEGYATERGHS
jgi:hypothetical protein